MMGLGPFVGSAVAVTATVVPVLRHRSHRLAVDEARHRAIPELIDLFRLGVGSGRSVHQLLEVVAPRAPRVFVPALDEVRRRVGLGQRLGDALDALDVLGESARPLAMALRSAAFDGIALGPALERVAADARLQRRRRAEIHARRLPIQLLFPLIVCVLPAFGLLAIVPLVSSAVSSLQW